MNFEASAYFLSLFSLVSIWLFDRKIISLSVFFLGITLSLINGIVTFPALLITSIFIFSNYLYFNYKLKELSKYLLWFIILILSISLSKHVLPGFEEWEIINGELISIDGEKYSLLLHIDKILAGFGIALFGILPIKNFHYFRQLLKRILPTAILAILTIATFGLLSGLARIDTKFPDVWLIWITVSLVMDCMTEEIIFRYFLQGSIYKFIKDYKYAPLISISISSFAFMLFLSSPSILYMFGVLIGSFFIGYSYHITKRVEAPIFLHFTINTIHFFFFTYPMLSHI